MGREPRGALMRVSGVHVAARQMTPTSDEGTPVPDHEARPDFPAFYQRSYPNLVAALSSTLADRELGREAADEAMARCYAHWSKVRHYDNPMGWVYRVGLNWALSVRRRLVHRYRFLRQRQHDAEIAYEPDLPADPQIAEALSELDVRLRAVVVCRVLLDYSTDQTAEVLGINPGTVKSRLHRALNRLREALAHLEGSHDGLA